MLDEKVGGFRVRCYEAARLVPAMADNHWKMDPGDLLLSATPRQVPGQPEFELLFVIKESQRARLAYLIAPKEAS